MTESEVSTKNARSSFGVNSLLVPATGPSNNENCGSNKNANSMAAPNTLPQKLNSGSATGNPRNKCALKPGHSLMDWVRLGNSGVDLAGTRGRVTPVSNEELAKHNTQNDAWLALRGNVYNVTRYMDFHPGGVDELMRGVGRDATKLFDDIHAWVNYQQLLAKCYIGPLRNVVKVDPNAVKSPPANAKLPSILRPPLPVNVEIVPRFDWIQKRADITFYFYTRSLCNPGLTLTHKSDSEFQIRILIEHTVHLYEFQLHESVKWPPQLVRISSETGKIEIQLRKADAAELWPSYGTFTVRKVSCAEQNGEELQYEYKVLAKQNFNHDSFEMSLTQGKTILCPPIGYHVNISAAINGETIERSYTPVQAKYLAALTQPETEPLATTDLNVLVKVYSDGLITPHLQQLNADSPVHVSAPTGNFKLQPLQKHRSFTLLAAGSGLTPFLNLIEHLLQRNNCRVDRVGLYYFNKTEADIWCRHRLEELQKSDERFEWKNILSQPLTDWTGAKGRISRELLAPLVDVKAGEYATYVAICGPNGFNQKAVEILRELKFNEKNLHIFQG